MFPFTETAQERFNRDWVAVKDDRKVRGWDQRPYDRRVREYAPHTEPDDEIIGSDSYTELYQEIY